MCKLFLGPPATPSACKICGKRVGVPYSATMLGLMFSLIVTILSIYVDSGMGRAIIWAAGGLIMSVSYLKWVPLIPRGSLARGNSPPPGGAARLRKPL